MKLSCSALIAGILVAACPGVLHSWGSLSIYSDPAMSQCTLDDATGRLASIYVAEITPLSVSVEFRVAASPGFTGVWLADQTPYVSFGSSQTGMGLFFGECLSGKFLVLTMAYQLFGTSTCSELSIAPRTGFPEATCSDCFHPYPCLNNGSLHVNCDGSFDCGPVATEPTTWGKVKALYRD